MQVNKALDELFNVQPHIASLPAQSRPFIDAHVDAAIVALRVAVERSMFNAAATGDEIADAIRQRGEKA